MAKHIIAGLDVGTSSVQIVVAERTPEGLRILGWGAAPTNGVRKGAVTEPEEVAESIRQAVVEAEKSAGIPFDSAYVSFGGCGLGMAMNKGVVAISRADGEISETDIERVVATAEAALPKQPNREFLHEIPLAFSVDKDINVKNPIGMIGTRLEAQVLFVTAFSPHLKNLIKSVELAGIAVEDIIAAPLALSRATLTKRQKEIGVMVLDLGAETASAAVFEEGNLLSAGVFPVGSTHITNDIAIGFQCPLPIAERIKLDHGMSPTDFAGKKDTIRLADYVPGDSTILLRRDLAEIIEARLKDIYGLVEKHLRKVGRAGLLPSGIVLVGGGAYLGGIVDFTKQELKLPVELGLITVGNTEPLQQLDTSWAIAMGLCVMGSETQQRSSFVPKFSGNFFKKIMQWVRPLIP